MYVLILKKEPFGELQVVEKNPIQKKYENMLEYNMRFLSTYV